MQFPSPPPLSGGDPPQNWGGLWICVGKTKTKIPCGTFVLEII